MKTMSKADISAEMTQSVLHTLSSMMAIEARVSSMSDGPPRRTACDISAVLSLSSSTLSGTVTLHVNSKLANRIAGAMLGDDALCNATEMTDETRDATGEFANIVVGSFKPMISTLVGEAVRMSVPTVIVGKHHITQTLSGGQWSEARIDIEGEELVIEMVFSEEQAQ